MSFDIFIYSSDVERDIRLRGDLGTHLGTLRNRGMINDRFVDATIAGNPENTMLFQDLDEADIIILLITPDFTSSPFCQQITQQAMEKHRQKGTSVLPILLRPTDYEEAEFAKLEMLPPEAKPVTEWQDQDTAFVNVIEGIKRVLATLPAQASMYNDLPLLAPRELGRISNLPFRKNLYFTGREKVLTQLRDTFVKGNHIQLLSGESAIGKTQTVLAYAYQYNEDYQYDEEDYQYLLWAGADSKVRLESDFVRLAGVLNLPEKSVQDQSSIIVAVKKWLQTHDKWLLIMDDVVDLQMVEKFLPQDVKGHVLLTARGLQPISNIPELPLDEMDDDEGALLLLHRVQLLPLEKRGLEILPDDIQSQAREITKMLEGQPLALELAGDYIVRKECSLDDYITYYRDQSKSNPKEFTQDQPNPIDMTWSLSFSMIQREFPEALDLFQLYAFLHPDTIPRDMITHAYEKLPLDLQNLVKDEQRFERFMNRLRKYSLIRFDAENKRHIIHRQVQRILKNGMDRAKQREWAEQTIRIVSHEFYLEPTQSAQWEQCERILPQALACESLSKDWNFLLPEMLYLVNNIAHYLKCRGRNEEAREFFEKGLALRRQMPGIQHLDIAQNLDCLATLYQILGMPEKAKEYYQEAQMIYEHSLVAISARLASVLTHRAEIYIEQCHFSEATTLLQRALLICESNSAHPLTQEMTSHIELLRKQIGTEEEKDEI